MSSYRAKKKIGAGPFRADQVRDGDRYELSDGHPVYCQPTGGDGAKRVGVGFHVIDTDPDVEDAGVDPGFTPSPGTLRAPDIAVGVPDKPGWIPGAPPFAIEYAGIGQDEDDLAQKIHELHDAGTRLIWVVRLTGPRRVEIHEPDKPVALAHDGDELLAPGILRNPVPVAALYDRDAAFDVMLKNLLQRRGYADFEEVLEAGRTQGSEQGREQGLEQGREQGLEEGRTQGLEQGREQGLEAGREQGLEAGREAGRADALLQVLAARGFSPSAAERALVLACRDRAQLDRWLVAAVTAPTLADVFTDAGA